MEKKNKLIEQLLLADYFIQQWYSFLEFKYAKITDFLAVTNILTVNKVMYFMCVASVSETDKGLFSTFEDWGAVPKGCVCDSFYSHLNSLYCLAYTKEKTFQLRSQIGVIDKFADHAYQNYISGKLNTLEEFQAYIRQAFPVESTLIDQSLKLIITFPYLNRMIVNNLTQDLVETNQRLPLWNFAIRRKRNGLDGYSLDFFQDEKRALFRLT